MDKENVTGNHKSDKNNTEMRNMISLNNNAKEHLCYNLDEVVRAWFNNKMMILLMRMQYIRAQDALGMEKSVFFLDEIEHHFISPSAPKPIRNAFRYLRKYIAVYPCVTKAHCERAFEMVTRLYRAMGYTFNYAPSFSGFVDRFKKRSGIEMQKNISSHYGKRIFNEFCHIEQRKGFPAEGPGGCVSERFAAI